MWSRSVPRPHRRPPEARGRHGAAQGRPDVEERCDPDDAVDRRACRRGGGGEGAGGPTLQHHPFGSAGTRGVRGCGDAVDRGGIEGAQRQVGRVDHLVRGAELPPDAQATQDLLRAERLPVHVDDVGAPDDAVRFGARDGPLVGVHQLGLRGHERCGAEEPACGGGPEGDAAGGGDHGAGDGGADELHGVHPARVTCACGPAHSGTGGAVPAGTAPPVRRAAGPRPARRRASPARSGRSRRAPCSSAGPS